MSDNGEWGIGPDGDAHRAPEGTEVTVTYTGVLTGYLDHLGSRRVKGTFVHNGAEWGFEVDVPPSAVIKVVDHASEGDAR